MPNINVPGIGEVYADGFAEEQTMQRILAVLSSADNANSAEAQTRLADASQRASTAVFGLGNAGTIASQATKRGSKEAEQGLTQAGRSGREFSTLMKSSSRTFISNFSRLDKDPFAATQGLVKVIGAAGDSLSKIPYLGTVLGGVTTAAAAAVGFVLEKMTATAQAFDKVQSTGALLGGSLLQLRINAHASSLTMSEFGNIFAKNGEAMASFGGQTLRGAREFARANQTLQEFHGVQLRQLGISFEDMGMATAEMIQNFALSGVSIQNAGIETKEFAIATANQVRLQKISAALTGRSIDQQKEAERQLRRDAAVQSAIQRLSGPTQAAIKNLIATMPQFKDVILDQIQGGTLMHKNSLMMAGMAPLQVEAMQETVEAIKSGATNAGPEFFKKLTDQSPAILREVQNQGDIAQLIRFSSNQFVQFAATTFPDAQKLMTASINNTVKDVMSDMERTLTDANATSKALFELEKENRKLAMAISSLTTGLLGRTNGITSMIALATKTATSGIEFLNKMFGAPSTNQTSVGEGNTEVSVNGVSMPAGAANSLQEMNNYKQEFEKVIQDLNKSLPSATNQSNLNNTTTTGSNVATSTSTGNNVVTVAAPTMEKQLEELLKQSSRTNTKMDNLTTNLT